MKVLKISPEKKPQVIDISLELDSLQKQVGGFIQVIYPFDDPVALICNEEGKLDSLPLNRVVRDNRGCIYDVISGDFLIVGLCEDDFMELTPQLITKYKAYYEKPEYFTRAYGHLVMFNMRGHFETIT